MIALSFAIYLECLFQDFAAYQRANGWPVFTRQKYARNRRWV